LGKYIHDVFSLDGSNRLISAERKIWEINIHQKFFKECVEELILKFTDLICGACNRNHATQNALRNCLWNHKSTTVSFYLDSLGDAS